jgi:Rrp15p
MLSIFSSEMSEEGIKGFAKAFSTILNRSVNEGESAVLAERTDVKENLKDKAVEDHLRKQLRESRKAKKINDGHVKVDALKKQYEKNLRKIATKGVVSIFNAVREFKEGNAAADANAARVDQMPMNSFMELLKAKAH